MAIQVTLSANQFNHSGAYNGRNYDSLQVKHTSKGRIYFSIVRDGIRLCEMAKQIKFEDNNAIVSFGKNNKLVIGTYSDDTIQEVIEEPATIEDDKTPTEKFMNDEYITNLEFIELCDQYNIELSYSLNKWCNDKLDRIGLGKYEYRSIGRGMFPKDLSSKVNELYEEIESATTNNTVDQLESNSEQPIKEEEEVNEMETNSINKLSNKDLTNILTKFAAMSEIKPELNYGYYNGQTMYATDSHKIISIDKSLINYLNNESDTHLYDILKGEKSDEQLKYPSVERLFDTYNNEEFTINKKEMVRLHKLIGTIKAGLSERYLYNIKLHFETVNSKLMIKGYTQNADYKETEYFNTGITANNISFILNAVFLADTLNTHKKLMKLTGDKELNVSYTGHLRPIKFNLQSGLVNVLLMPIRKY